MFFVYISHVDETKWRTYYGGRRRARRRESVESSVCGGGRVKLKRTDLRQIRLVERKRETRRRIVRREQKWNDRGRGMRVCVLYAATTV